MEDQDRVLAWICSRRLWRRSENCVALAGDLQLAMAPEAAQARSSHLQRQNSPCAGANVGLHSPLGTQREPGSRRDMPICAAHPPHAFKQRLCHTWCVSVPLGESAGLVPWATAVKLKCAVDIVPLLPEQRGEAAICRLTALPLRTAAPRSSRAAHHAACSQTARMHSCRLGTHAERA